MNERMMAAQAGQKFYNGGTCKRCGSTYRHVVSGSCVECTRMHSRITQDKYRQALKEAIEMADRE